MRKIHVQNISIAGIAITLILGCICIVIFMQGRIQFEALQQATKTYIGCEEDARQLESGSDFLTEQVRMIVLTGDTIYIDRYFNEATETKRRDEALGSLKGQLEGTSAFDSLQNAMDQSSELMYAECYAIRLICDAYSYTETVSAHEELRAIEISGDDELLPADEKVEKARNLVSGSEYQTAKDSINTYIDQCVAEITETARAKQGRAVTIFEDVYRKLEIFVVIFAVLTLAMGILIRRAIVRPLMDFNAAIESNTLLPIKGAGELRILAKTYNRVYEENEATQLLIKHQAEHDALTDLFNRRLYDELLDLYENSDADFALVLIDVDTFKQVNDTYGHTAGDSVLKRVSTLLKTTFRSIDHVCRIGGDEFAVIMTDATSQHRHAIKEKISAINKQLACAENDVPAVSLSVGVAFADRDYAGSSIFKDADRALYYTKKHGRNNCTFYGDPGTV